MKRSIHSTRDNALRLVPGKILPARQVQPPASEAGLDMPSLLTSGLKYAVQARRNWLDAVEQCHASTAHLYRQAFQFLPAGMFVLDVAEQAFAGYIEMQRRTLDLVMEQSKVAEHFAELMGGRMRDTVARATSEGTVEHAMDIAIGASSKLPDRKHGREPMDIAIGASGSLPKKSLRKSKRGLHLMPSGKAAKAAA